MPDIPAIKARYEAGNTVVQDWVRTGEWPREDMEGWEFMAEVANALDDIPQLVQALEDAQQAVRIYIVEMDEAMKGPATRERGIKIAELVSSLQDAILGESS